MDHLQAAQLTLPFMFGLGLQHGMGPDHLAAITTLIARGHGERRAVWVGVKFGLGHMGALAGACLLCLALNLTISERFERAAEIGGGLLLIVMGLWMIRDLFGVEVYAHHHRHSHDGHEHTHVHLHLGAPATAHPHAHGHPHLSTLFGGLFAFSGARWMIVMIAELVAGHPAVPRLLIAIAAFGAGIITAMALYGALISRCYGLASRHALVFRAVTLLTIVATVGTGALWVSARV